MKKPKLRRKIQTFLIHGHTRTRRWDYGHHIVPPMSSSVAYRLDSTERGARGFKEFASRHADPDHPHPIYIYDRLDEPTRSLLEDALAHAEHGDIGVCFGSGMGAVSAALGVLVKSGDEVISHPTIYGCTYSLLTSWYPRLGITVKWVDLTDPGALKKAITPKTRVVYFETPANPTLQLIDIRAVTNVVKQVSRRNKSRPQVVVDNTFATPYGQRPLTLGADLVVHSLTKGLGGFGADMGGAVITRKEFWHDLLLYRKDFGAVLSPKAAWPILVYGLPSLALRVKAQQASALAVAQFLEKHQQVKWVRYPGLGSFPDRALARRQMVDETGTFAPGTLITFELQGGRRAAARFLDRLAKHAYSVTLAVSLGQVRTLIEAPSLMTHAAFPRIAQAAHGMDAGMIRLSLGLEDVQDIIQDLEHALR